MDNVKSSPYYALCFDESHNKIIKEEQMDMHLRFLCDEKGSVQTCYFESRFLKWADAETISQEVIQSLLGMPGANVTSVSMNSPTPNWPVMDKLNIYRNENELPLFLK